MFPKRSDCLAIVYLLNLQIYKSVEQFILIMIQVGKDLRVMA